MNFQETCEYLDSFINYEKDLHKVNAGLFKLERVDVLLKALGSPQEQLKIIHVAGSKGKGSTCAMTASVLKEAGYKVGLYTSPHIYNFRERIRILGNDRKAQKKDIFPDAISEQELCRLLEETKSFIDPARTQNKLGRLSFFEVYTALALYYFKQQKSDIVVLETGLGGRLDATNADSGSH